MKARENGISEARAVGVAFKESSFNWSAKGDMEIVCNNPRSSFHGKPVEARGIYQLTKCYYPDVPDEVAYDPIQAIDLVFERRLLVGNTCRSQFSTCRNL